MRQPSSSTPSATQLKTLSVCRFHLRSALICTDLHYGFTRSFRQTEICISPAPKRRVVSLARSRNWPDCPLEIARFAWLTAPRREIDLTNSLSSSPLAAPLQDYTRRIAVKTDCPFGFEKQYSETTTTATSPRAERNERKPVARRNLSRFTLCRLETVPAKRDVGINSQFFPQRLHRIRK